MIIFNRYLYLAPKWYQSPTGMILVHQIDIDSQQYLQSINIYMIILFGGNSVRRFFHLGLSMRFSELEFSVKYLRSSAVFGGRRTVCYGIAVVLLYWENLAAARTRERLLVLLDVTRATIRGTSLLLNVRIIRITDTYI